MLPSLSRWVWCNQPPTITAASMQVGGRTISSWSCPWRRAPKAGWPRMRKCLACWAGTAAWTSSERVQGRWGVGWQV